MKFIWEQSSILVFQYIGAVAVIGGWEGGSRELAVLRSRRELEVGRELEGVGGWEGAGRSRRVGRSRKE